MQFEFPLKWHDKQSWFDAAIDYLLKIDRRSTGADGICCVYQDALGGRCVIGAFMDDTPPIDGDVSLLSWSGGADELFFYYPDKAATFAPNRALAVAIQIIHDIKPGNRITWAGYDDSLGHKVLYNKLIQESQPDVAIPCMLEIKDGEPNLFTKEGKQYVATLCEHFNLKVPENL